MNVKTLCLAVLYEGEATGYEIRRMCVEGECSYFVEASFGSIYPALAKLEDEGLVTSRVEQQSGKPAKKVYSITEGGRRASVSELYEPIDEDVFRSPFLLFARYVHLLPAELVEKRITDYLAKAREEKKQVEDMSKDHQSPADQWIIRYGLAHMGLAVEYLETHMRELVGLAQAERVAKDAAE